MTSISQLQMTYSAEEDRILFRLNTSAQEEFRFWLTRRYSQLLIQALNSHKAADPDVVAQPTNDARQAVQDFKREAAQEKGDFKSEFRESTSFPLGNAPAVAFKLSYKVEDGVLKLSMQPKEGQGINLVLDSNLNFNVTKLLKGASDKAGWGLDWGEAAVVEENRVIN